MKTANNLCAIITQRPDAVAFLNGSEKYKEIRGQIFFYELSDSVIVRAEVSGFLLLTNLLYEDMEAVMKQEKQ